MRYLVIMLSATLLTWMLMSALRADVPVSPDPVSQMAEQRYCGEPARDADGTIRRSAAARAAFVRAHPCPVTGATSGGCLGWAVDHVLPLACGGCDAVSNMQWLPNAIKSCAAATGVPCKDRWERLIYCTPMQVVK